VCRAISDPASRLQCFDELASLTPYPVEETAGAPAPSSPVVSALPESRWRVEIQRDLMGGPNRSYVVQTATTYTGSTDRAPFLTLRCGVERDTLEILYTPQIYLGRPIRGSEDIKVRLRFDGKAPSEQSWSPSTNQNAAFAYDPRRLYETLLRHETVVLEAEAHNTRLKVAAEFSLAGLAEAASALRGCLPPLPPAEITRDHGIEADLVTHTASWHVLRRPQSAGGVGSGMLGTYGMIDTMTGNQDALFLWCEGTNMVGRWRFQGQISPQPSQVRIVGPRTDSLTTYTNPRRVDDRTVALPDPRAVVRSLSDGQPFSLGAIVVSRSGFPNVSFLVGQGLTPAQLQVLAPCIPAPRPQPASRPPR
jgi:hypothetical protein